MSQLYDLGKILRQHYIETSELVSPTFNYEDVYIRSTAYNRCLMSSISLLTGLYPNSQDSSSGLPTNYTAFAQDVIEKSREVLLRGYKNWYDSFVFFLYSKLRSPRSTELYTEWSKTSEADSLYSQYKDSLDKASSLLGERITYANQEEMLDSIYVDSIHKFLFFL